MVEERVQQGAVTEQRKRKNRFKKPPNSKKMKVVPGMGKKAKVSKKLKKLYSKRAREYNSDSDDGKESDPESMDEEENEEREGKLVRNDDGEEHDGGEEEGSDEEEKVPPMKFVAGCNGFKTAFQKIMSIPAEDETLGPILSAHKKLVVAKLAAEDTEKKFVKEKKKIKISIDEKGHVKPENYLDTHDKVLIGIATKGVVKFFNAVNKAQTAQKGLNPSRFKDAKVLTKRRKEAFMSELNRDSSQSVEASTGKEDSNQPAWAPLRDSFMLTNTKLKDWDKMAEETEPEADI